MGAMWRHAAIRVGSFGKGGLVVILIALLSGTAMAETGKVDHGLVDACYQTMRKIKAVPDCLGRAAEVCYYKPPMHGATLDMGYCLASEADAWLAILMREVEHDKQRFRGPDNRRTDGFSVVEDLAAAQFAWLQFRDANCAVVYSVNGPSTMPTIAVPTCKLHMTAERIIAMKRSLRPFGGSMDTPDIFEGDE